MSMHKLFSCFHPARRVWLIRLLPALVATSFSAAANAQGYLGRLLDDFNEVKALSQRKQRIELENDVFFNTDRNYTDGVRYGYKYLGLRAWCGAITPMCCACGIRTATSSDAWCSSGRSDFPYMFG